MKNLFSVDSKFYQTLMRISEWILLNLLYLLCSVPVVTAGAAQAGLMNAIRVMRDKEDDSSVYKAFFRGFRSGFWKITLIWTLCFAYICVLGYTALMSVYYDGLLGSSSAIMSAIALVVLMAFLGMAVTFHSRFDCSLWQIVRNSLLLVLLHPFRSIGIVVAIWAPAILALFQLEIFLKVTPILLFGYYTVALQYPVLLMEKPFAKIETEHMEHCE